MAPTPESSAGSSRADDERYRRLMSATRRAAQNGYEAVSMRELARETRMSMTTIYQYCSSKDHLIAEAHLDRMERLSLAMMKRPPRGKSAQARLLTYAAEVTAAWTEHETLLRTLQRAIYSLEPGVLEVRASLVHSHLILMELLIGEEQIANRANVIEIIGNVLDSVTYRWVGGGLTADEARRVLERTIRTLVPRPG